MRSASAILEAAVALSRKGTRAFHGYLLAQVLKTGADRRTLTAHGTLSRALHLAGEYAERKEHRKLRKLRERWST